MEYNDADDNIVDKKIAHLRTSNSLTISTGNRNFLNRLSKYYVLNLLV